MKKIILLLCILGLTTTAHAACNGGSEQSGLCVSNITMNWWSAAAWCKANGMSLVTIYDICPDWDGNPGSGKCPVLGSGGGWTATVINSSAVVTVSLTGNVNTSFSRKDYTNAICK